MSYTKKQLKKIYETCIYCREQKIHPSFAKEMLCSSCASDVIEDYQTRMGEHEKTNHEKINLSKR